MRNPVTQIMQGLVAAGVLAVSLHSIAQDGMDDGTRDKLKAAMSAEDRPEADKARDRNRKPVETLEFFGFRDDMTVVEIVPAGGWYSRLLMPTLAENGKLYFSLGTRGIPGLSDVPGFEEAEILEAGAFGARDDEGRFAVDPFSMGVTDVDLVLTFRNMHNFSASGRANLNAAAFEALKSGGHYGVVDHTRRHMQPHSREVGRREDPVSIIKEVQAAGFELVDYSTLHYKPDDELRYEVGRASVKGNSDRFTLLFRKP